MAISSGLSSEDSRTTIQWTAAGILLPFVMVADGRQQSCPTPTDLPMPKISKLRILSSVYYKIIVLIHRIKMRYYRRQSVQCSASYVISFGSYLFRFEFQAPPTDPKRTVIKTHTATSPCFCFSNVHLRTSNRYCHSKKFDCCHCPAQEGVHREMEKKCQLFHD
jgi:hypothetical protein